MDNLSDILKKEAIGRNLCARWQMEWADNSDQQTLIDKYKRGIDFVIEQGEWPTNRFIKENFDTALLRDNLIFVDERLDIKDAPSGVYILNGGCSGVIRFRSWSAGTVYVRHTSDVCIIAEDFSKVFVRLYDDAKADTVALDDAVVKIYDRR